MIAFVDKVPKYLLGKSQLVSTVLFTAFFSLVGLLMSVPYSQNAWFRLGPSQAFTFTALFYLIALLVVILSKYLMVKVSQSVELSFMHYVFWNAGEVIAVCLLYIFFTIKADNLGLINLEIPITNLFVNSLVYCFVTIGMPYTICGMYFAINDKDNTIRLMNIGNTVSDEVVPPLEENRITLFDNTGALKFSVRPSNLYFIESDDNYIKVWYTDTKGVLKQYMLRCRLKTVEDGFAENTDLVRCHRKYIVNMGKVRILTREKDGYELQLDSDAIEPIPVSKTYEENVLSTFNSRG